MDKLTKEDYRKYLVDAYKEITEKVKTFGITNTRDSISVVRLHLEIVRELYKIDNEKE